MDFLYEKFVEANQLYNFHYHSLLQDILNAEEITNQRTGTKIKALPNRVIGYSIGSTLPLINTRKMFPVTAFAELCWTLSGVKELDWLQQHTQMWNEFANDKNQVEAAYGYRWRHMFGRDQIFSALTALIDDPSDRQIFISAWDNGKDGLGNRWTSNVPCPTCFSINIIDDKLNLTLFLRSSDTIVGLPYDMLMYSLLLIVFTHSLRKWYPNLQYGRIDAMLSHAHIYEAHYDIAKDLIKNAKSGITTLLPDSFDISKVYRIQDIDLNNCNMLWRLQDLTNIVQDPDTAMIMFKDCIYSQFDGKQKFPPMYKPEIIK